MDAGYSKSLANNKKRKKKKQLKESTKDTDACLRVVAAGVKPPATQERSVALLRTQDEPSSSCSSVDIHKPTKKIGRQDK